jgi:hypothetical protein
METFHLPDYGHITTGDGSKLAIVDVLQASYLDNRTISVMSIEDQSIAIAIENLPSSGRNPQQTLRLSQESLAAVLMSAILYFSAKGVNLDELTRRVVAAEQLRFIKSANLGEVDLERDMPRPPSPQA